MKKFVLFTILLACFSHMWADISVQTKIYDGNTQPPIVGGVISEYSESSIQEKGLIISASADGCVYDATADKYNHNFSAKNEYKNPHSILETYRIIDCSNIGKEQFWCSVLALKSNTDYYVRAYLVKEDGNVIYGEVKQIHSQTFNRYNRSTDYANVWHAFDYTLFDLISDEIINPNDGFYYSTNENPTTVRHQVGTSYNTCYKYATEWNYKLWYYHSGHCVQTKIVDMPVMTLSGNKLHIEKSTLDADKDITIYYSINGDYFRPETYTDIYSNPIEIKEPCTVYCYAISSDGYISYTNMYVIDEVQNGNESHEYVDEYVDLGLPSGTLWATCNVGANRPEECGLYFMWAGVQPSDITNNSVPYMTEDGKWTKYTTRSEDSSTGVPDNKISLEPEDDAAYVMWGEGWRIPSKANFEELISECSWKWITQNGVKGYQVTGPNGNTIFIPESGNSMWESSIVFNGVSELWTNELHTSKENYYVDAFYFTSNSQTIYSGGVGRGDILAIRPIFIGEEDGIENVRVNDNGDGAHNGGKRVIYDLYGRCQPKMQKGLNIVKYADGSVKRIMVK